MSSDELDMLFENENLRVTTWLRGRRSLIVSFTSAGGAAYGRNMHEFRATLDACAVDMIFFTDKKLRWYNYPEAVKIFEMVAAVAMRYDFIGAIGSSMGGSGAILFSNFCLSPLRILSFCPQYSIKPPFVDFDNRYYEIGRAIDHIWPNFSSSPRVESCTILYGTADWKDYLHGSMFRSVGFHVSYIQGGPHELPQYIKKIRPGALFFLIRDFFDFSGPVLNTLLGEHFADYLLETPDYNNEGALQAVWDQKIKNPNASNSGETAFDAPCISTDKFADESSRWLHANGVDSVADASLALSGQPTGKYSFHTSFEDRPNWTVNLGKPFNVTGIEIFNRMDTFGFAKIFRDFELQGKSLGEEWQVILRNSDRIIFGGVDGRPFRWSSSLGIRVQWLKIQLLQPGYLHLDKVRIYGHEL